MVGVNVYRALATGPRLTERSLSTHILLGFLSATLVGLVLYQPSWRWILHLLDPKTTLSETQKRRNNMVQGGIAFGMMALVWFAYFLLER
jgi:hypothetical protein